MRLSHDQSGAPCCDEVSFFLRNFELCHNTSVITSHVNCVVGLCVFAPAVVFSVSQEVIQLFLRTFLGMVSHLILRSFLKYRVQNNIQNIPNKELFLIVLQNKFLK